jgi:transcriptional regulator with XRE-family HTH domain
MFGERLKRLREEKEVSQKDLGKAISIHERVVGYWESGNRFPRNEDMLNKIADYFGVSTDYLVGRTKQRNPKRVYNLDELKTMLPPEYKDLFKILDDDYIEFIVDINKEQIPIETLKALVDIIKKTNK